MRQWNDEKENRSPSKEVRKAYYLRNKEKILKATHNRYIQNRDLYLKYQTEYIQRNKKLISEKQKQVRKNKLVSLINLLGNKCNKCGLSYPSIVYDFHHRNPEDKSFTIGECMGYKLETLMEEAQKCDLLCANCHRIIHDCWTV